MPANKPLKLGPSQLEPLPRGLNVGMIFLGIALLVAMHLMARTEKKVNLFLLLIAPVLGAIGVTGTISPRVALAFRPEGAALEAREKVAAGIAIITGLLISAVLYFFVYPTTASESLRGLFGGPR